MISDGIKDLTIGMIGLGKLGLDCAEVFAKDFTVYGYDIYPRESEDIIISNSIHGVVEHSDWIFIAVPTPHEACYGGEEPSCHLEPKDFDYSIVKDVLKEINECDTTGKHVVLISTVLPGVVREQLDPLLTNHTLIYNPYLIAMGSVKWDMVNPEMVIIGTEEGEHPEELSLIYSKVMERSTRIIVGTWEEAEAIKIFYNTFISAKVSLVNMIQDFAMKIGHMDSKYVAKALAESDMRIMGPQYMVPGMGDAGACHPRDNIALRYLAKKYEIGYDMFGTIMGAREKQAENMALFIENEAKKRGMPIVIHGKAYKPKVPYEIGSYSLLVGHYLEKRGWNVFYADPLTDDDPGPMKAIVLMAHNSNITYAYTENEDLMDQKDSFYFDVQPGSVLIDPWGKLEAGEMPEYEVIHYGNTR